MNHLPGVGSTVAAVILPWGTAPAAGFLGFWLNILAERLILFAGNPILLGFSSSHSILSPAHRQSGTQPR